MMQKWLALGDVARMRCRPAGEREKDGGLSAEAARTGRLSVHYYVSKRRDLRPAVRRNEWRSRSKRGRYEHTMWKAADLEEPSGRWRQDVQGGATWTGEDDGARTFEGDEAMDNLRAHPQWQR